MSQLQNKNIRKLKNIVHIAVHFPMGTSKVCNKISIMYKIKYVFKYLLLLLLSSHNVCLESLGPGSNHDPGALGDSQFLD